MQARPHHSFCSFICICQSLLRLTTVARFTFPCLFFVQFGMAALRFLIHPATTDGSTFSPTFEELYYWSGLPPPRPHSEALDGI